MPTVKELRAIARDYWIPGRSRLRKASLIDAIAEARAAEHQKRIQRATETGRFPAPRDDQLSPHKKWQRWREARQLMNEIDLSLRAKKYETRAKKNPRLRLKPQKALRMRRVVRAIQREGPELLASLPAPLDPEVYYALYDNGASVLFPEGDYVRTGRQLQSKAQVLDAIRATELIRPADQATLNERFELRPIARGPDITDEGSVYWLSFENQRLRVTHGIASIVVEMLDPDQHYKLFTIIGRAAKEPLATVAEEVGASEIRITGHLIFRGDQITAGALEGIDAHIWEKGREYLVFVRYELRPLLNQQGELGPMFLNEEENQAQFVNCFIRRVVTHFEREMSKAGQKLTPNRRRILERFDAQLAATGCTREDMYRLEAALNVKLVAVDALGNTLWDSGKYGKRTKIIVPCHNNHAWSEIPIDPPKIAQIRGFDIEAEHDLSALSRELRNRRTTAAQKTIEQRAREIILSFVDRQWRLPEKYNNRISSETRLWLCGETLMGSDGTLWRSVSTQRAIDCAFEDETRWSPQDICDDPEETFDCIGLRDNDRAVILSHLQAQVDRGERVLPSEVYPFIENEESRQALSELIFMMWLSAEYHRASHSMGGASSYRFQKWLARENIKPTPDKYRAIWQMAQVEAKVWNSSDAGAAASDHHHLDMRAAYLACEDSDLGGVGDAIDLVRQYGFPTNMMRRANVEGVPLSDVLTLTGAIQLTRWRFNQETHPFTVGRIGEHLRENQGWITTPKLADLVDSGDMIEAEAREVIYSVGTKPSINFPSDRDLAVRFVGKCARHGFETSIIVRDPNEAAYLTNYLGGTDRLLNFEHAGDVHLIQYKDTKVRAQWFHIRAFVLAYTNIGLRRMLRRFPQDDVLRICTDALYVKKLPEEVENMLVEERPRYGHWRHKKPGYDWRPEAAAWKIEHEGQLDLAPTSTPRLPLDIKAAATRCMYLAGQGGSGKTHWAVETFRGRRLVVLVPENDLAEKHRKDERLGLKAEQVQTLHHYFCLPIGKPIESWDPVALGRRLDGIAEVIIIDESLKIPSKILQVVLDYLARRTCQVICAGDLGQIPPWGDKSSPHELLLAWAGPGGVRWFDTDYRALCEACGDPFSYCHCQQGPKSALHAVKAQMWRTSDQNQLDVFSESFTSTPFRARRPRTFGCAQRINSGRRSRDIYFAITGQITPDTLLEFDLTQMTMYHADTANRASLSSCPGLKKQSFQLTEELSPKFP